MGKRFVRAPTRIIITIIISIIIIMNVACPASYYLMLHVPYMPNCQAPSATRPFRVNKVRLAEEGVKKVIDAEHVYLMGYMEETNQTI